MVNTQAATVTYRKFLDYGSSAIPETNNQINLPNLPKYIYSQNDSSSSLIIGPIRLSHSIQNIDISEQRSVETVQATRSDKDYIVDSGESVQKAVITLIFTGNEVDMPEINLGLRSLITLFRVSPITSLKNELISRLWKIPTRSYNEVETFFNKVKKLQDTLLDDPAPSTASSKDLPFIHSYIKTGKVYSDFHNTVDKNNFKHRLRIYGDGITQATPVAFKPTKVFSDYIPVTLEQLSLSTLPDLPYTIQATLVVSRIDVSSGTGGDLYYYSKPSIDQRNSINIGGPTVDPSEAYWLKKWMTTLLNTSVLPKVVKEDFDLVISWYQKNAAGALVNEPVLSKDRRTLNFKTNTFVFGPESLSKCTAVSCSISNKFVYNKLIGKAVPFAQHLGISSRALSMDLLFDTKHDVDTFQGFVDFKETASEIILSSERIDRLCGWSVKNPLTLLLSKVGETGINQGGAAGVYVPLTFNTRTISSTPHLRSVSVDLIENNIDIFENRDIILHEGGTDLDELRAFFIGSKNHQIVNNSKEYYGIIPGDLYFRVKRYTGSIPKDFTGISTDINSKGTDLLSSYRSYEAFWPLSKSGLFVNTTESMGILNSDTLRAVFLDRSFDTGIDEVSLSGGTTKLVDALRESILATTQAYVGPNIPGIIPRSITTTQIIKEALVGNDLTNPVEERIRKIIRGYLNKAIIIPQYMEDIRRMNVGVEVINGVRYSPLDAQRDKDLDLIADKLTRGYLGNFNGLFDLSNETGEILQILNRSPYKFTSVFVEALFNVLIKRPGQPESLPYVYNTTGIHKAFFKLINEYLLYSDSSGESKYNINKTTNKYYVRSTYPDLLLPTYVGLYTPSLWTSYAPTYDDVGISAVLTDRFEIKNDPMVLQKNPAVSENDYVHPSAWFYSKKNKDALREAASKGATLATRSAEELHLSVPFDIDSFDKLEQQLNAIEASANVTSVQVAKQTLAGMIKEAYLSFKSDNPAAFNQDIDLLNKAATSKFYDKFFSKDSKTSLYVYLHHNGNIVSPKRVTNGALLGSEIYNALNDLKLLRSSSSLPPYSIADEEYRTVNRSLESGFVRNLADNTDTTIQSSLSQIPDDFDTMKRFWPTLKVYLIDRRGNDIIADDAFYGLGSLISVSVTLDKDDADLAVITVADPLMSLQTSFFSKSNIATTSDSIQYQFHEDAGWSTKSRQIVLGSLKATDWDGTMKRLKIAQGRSIQIRAGYENSPENLKIIFTGRITEINPGDVLTIVAQGWKAELINRQVSFYSDDPLGWGAQDLAVQAIQKAGEAKGLDCFGDLFPQQQADYILKNLSAYDSSELIQQVLRVQEDSPIEFGNKKSGLTYNIGTYFTTLLGFASPKKQNTGFDTRLKNIWYPDTTNYNNVLGWRSTFSTMPSYINDSWCIPLQSCWDVLKEASRHAWNCIVQVVPYDGEATIFFGNPDQPYYFTRGASVGISKASKFRESERKRMSDLINGTILEKFIRSSFYDDPSVPSSSRKVLYTDTFVNALGAKATEGSLLTDPASVIKLTYGYETNLNGNTYATPLTNNYSKIKPCFTIVEKMLSINPALSKNIEISGLPHEKYRDAYTISQYIADVIIESYFGIDTTTLANIWPSRYRDIEYLLSNTYDKTSGKFTEIISKLSSSRIRNSEDKDKNKTDRLLSKDKLIDDASAIITYMQVLFDSVILDSLNAQPGTLALQKDYRSNVIRNGAPRAREMYKELLANMKTAHIEEASLIDVFTTYTKEIPNILEASIEAGGVSSKDRRMMSLLQDKLLAILYTRNNKIVDSIIDKKDFSATIGETLDDNLGHFKAFCYFFCSFFTSEVSDLKDHIPNLEGIKNSTLFPTMQVFRVHHWVDDDRDIIRNDIVASTKEMWNTVVIEHPKKSLSKKNLNINADDVDSAVSINSGVNWIYYPKKEVTGVIGLQFHPGLSLSNKKVKVFTELNCVGEELAAKLACTHLADGIRRMYRGNLVIKGRVIKPHDRISILDRYTNISGPVEVESVIHNWNLDVGWTTHILPQTVCDANPGAAILQTGVLEATFNKIFAPIDWTLDALTYYSLFSSLILSGPANLAKGAAKDVSKTFIRGAIKQGLINIKDNAVSIGGTLLKSKGNPLAVLRGLWASHGGLSRSLSRNFALAVGAETASNMWFRLSVIPGFIEKSKDVAQLPVIISPLMFNGLPLTAGLESDDALFSVYLSDTFYSLRDLQLSAEAYINELIGDV